jgi:hypothetical protein
MGCGVYVCRLCEPLRWLLTCTDCCCVGQATANKLTDDALLDIFDFYLNDNIPDGCQNVDKWHTLVHVCRRWRDLVFASPRCLNLRLHCKKDTPVREMLDIWPALPIVIYNDRYIRTRDVGLDNIVAALEHPDRVRSIELQLGVTRHDNAGSILRVDISVALVRLSLYIYACPSRFVLGWIRPTSANTPFGGYSISGTAEPTFVCQ